MSTPDVNPLPPSDPGAAAEQEARRLARRATWMLMGLVLLLLASGAYLLYARGLFEPQQRLVLISDDSEGVTVGMDVTFSGFPIGRVQRIELAGDGNARIVVSVPRKDAAWLRTSSVFTLERSLVGSTRIRAYSGVLTDPPLEDGAERQVLRGDASAEIPRLMSAVRDLLANLGQITAADSALNTSLSNLQTVTGRLQGPQGALAAILGNEADARKVVQTLERTNALLARLDGLAARADAQVFGERGLVPSTTATVQSTQATVEELRGLLVQARQSLARVDAVLVEAQGVAANTRAATTDLSALRADVESSLRRVDHLINEVNRKWPFARDTEVRLP